MWGENGNKNLVVFDREEVLQFIKFENCFCWYLGFTEYLDFTEFCEFKDFCIVNFEILLNNPDFFILNIAVMYSKLYSVSLKYFIENSYRNVK